MENKNTVMITARTLAIIIIFFKFTLFNGKYLYVNVFPSGGTVND
jgi:hypothetical protein